MGQTSNPISAAGRTLGQRALEAIGVINRRRSTLAEVSHADRLAEQQLDASDVLEAVRDAMPPILHVEATEVDAVNCDCPRRWLV